MLLLSLVITGESVHAADITGTWQLRGTVQVDASIKNQQLTSKTVDNATLVLGAQKHFIIDGSAFQLSGIWALKGSAFQGSIDTVSAAGFLNNIVSDLKAKSGLILKSTSSKSTLMGTKLANGTITGEWLIISKITFPKYPAPAGLLRMSYRFTGKHSK
jgi:hypothetical protein